MAVGKIKWGGETTADEIEKVEVRGAMYDGPTPPNGVYQFKATLKRGISQSGKKKIDALLRLVPRKGRGDEKYKGCPVWDTVPDVAFRIRALCDALGVSSTDFLNNQMVEKETGLIRKIGALVIPPDGIEIVANVAMDNGGEGKDGTIYAPRLRVNNYLPYTEPADDSDDAEDDADSDDDDADDSDAPF